ncbi:glycosyltransferase [Tatumella saanichensis]|uniref:glycosyltransferase n=1 Tax=Tatumella saanichensis TaxID=480813 RepID=UPI0004A2EAE2|nr:glycosyltransferase [Tatumella saanichensis]
MKIVSLIVTYNRCEKLLTTLEATLALPFSTVVVVDNCSSDGTSEILAQQNDPRLEVLTATQNCGGAAGFALGAEYIAQHVKSDWVLFFDDDAYPDSSFIERFQEICRPEYSLYCAKVLDTKGQLCKMNVPWRTSQGTFASSLKYLKRPQDFIPQVDQVTEVVTFSFVGCVISHDLLVRTWQFIDKDIFIYFDDVFYSWKLHVAGKKILYHPNLVIHHDIKTSPTDRVPAWKVYYLVRNMLLSRYILAGKPFFSMTAISLRLIKYLLSSLRGPERKKRIYFFFKGVMDGVLNRRKSL